jgi:hypothetical protein
MIRGFRSTFPASQEALSAKLAKLYSSGKRLPYRLAHAARVALEVLGWIATFRVGAGLRRRRDARLLRRSGLFDVEYYLSQCAGDPRAARDPVTHYLARGAKLGLDPNPLFDTSAYAARNPAARGENPLVHLLRSRGAARSGAEAAAEAAAAARWEEGLLAAEALGAAPSAAGSRELPGVGSAPPTPGRAVAFVEAAHAPSASAGAGPTADAPARRLSGAGADGRGSVLAVGVYLSERENNAVEISRELARSRDWRVEQRWIALGNAPVPEPLAAVTTAVVRARTGKFTLVNRLVPEADLGRHDFVLVCDDDIALPEGFVDRYLALVRRYDLALAQPARTHDSYVENWIVEQLDGLVARRTRFVEIGPLFSIRRDAARILMPFDEAAPMGWGYDVAWPVAVERAGLRMGIVDATPVAHKMRKTVSLYDVHETAFEMRRYLARTPHLTPHEAFSIVEAYS